MYDVAELSTAYRWGQNPHLMAMSSSRRAAAMSRITGAAVAIATASTLFLRIVVADVRYGARPAWLTALAVLLALLAIRLGALAAAVRRGELRWSRLLLPAIFLVEGLCLWWGDGGPAWQSVRLATAIALELTVIVLAIHHLRRAPYTDELPEDRLAHPLRHLLPPRVARLIALELTVLGLALRHLLGGWRRPSRPGFSYHRDATLRMLLLVLPLIATADVVLLELVILPRVALWIKIVVHALAIYSVLWLIGLWASFRARPHQVHDGLATLHRGFLRHIAVPLDQIVSIKAMPTFSDDWKLRAYRKRAIRIDVSGPPTLEIRLRAPLRPISMFGPGSASDRLLVSVDDPSAFIASLGSAKDVLDGAASIENSATA
jgi:hypothetical protein